MTYEPSYRVLRIPAPHNPKAKLNRAERLKRIRVNVRRNPSISMYEWKR